MKRLGDSARGRHSAKIARAKADLHAEQAARAVARARATSGGTAHKVETGGSTTAAEEVYDGNGGFRRKSDHAPHSSVAHTRRSRSRGGAAPVSTPGTPRSSFLSSSSSSSRTEDTVDWFQDLKYLERTTTTAISRASSSSTTGSGAQPPASVPDISSADSHWATYWVWGRKSSSAGYGAAHATKIRGNRSPVDGVGSAPWFGWPSISEDDIWEFLSWHAFGAAPVLVLGAAIVSVLLTLSRSKSILLSSLLFCDTRPSVDDDLFEECKKCPSHGICSGGILARCERGYAMAGSGTGHCVRTWPTFLAAAIRAVAASRAAHIFVAGTVLGLSAAHMRARRARHNHWVATWLKRAWEELSFSSSSASSSAATKAPSDYVVLDFLRDKILRETFTYRQVDQYRWLWDTRVVPELETDSRLRVESRRIHGEDRPVIRVLNLQPHHSLISSPASQRFGAPTRGSLSVPGSCGGSGGALRRQKDAVDYGSAPLLDKALGASGRRQGTFQKHERVFYRTASGAWTGAIILEKSFDGSTQEPYYTIRVDPHKHFGVGMEKQTIESRLRPQEDKC